MRYIYSFFWYLILPFLLLKLLWRARKNRWYLHHIKERFGFNGFIRSEKHSVIWIHAVSVGEAVAVGPLIKSLLNKYPQKQLVVTTMTPTGRAQVKRLFPNEVVQIYLPYDYPFAVKRFLQQLQPEILIVMETEIWPNLFHYAAKFNVPVMLVNARLSLRSYQGYSRIKFFIKSSLNNLTKVIAQSSLDAERFLLLGCRGEKIVVLGNMKFDCEVPLGVSDQVKLLKKQLGERPVLVAASTHEGEEEKVLQAFNQVLREKPDTLLILVPRHPERFSAVAKLCIKQRFNTTRFSNLSAEYHRNTQVLVGDVMGQLLLFYGVADLAFVGGTLVPWGGHNLLEPALMGKPVLSGPHLNAFLEISRLLSEANAMFIVQDEIDLGVTLVKLLSDKKLGKVMGENALGVVAKNQGSVQNIVESITKVLDDRRLIVAGKNVK